MRSGRLLQQSTILKCWKDWFDLWSDCHLIYYDGRTQQSIEDEINSCTGHGCGDIQPPDGKPRDRLLQMSADTGRPSVSVQRAQTIAWHGSLHCRIPEQTQLTLAQQSCLKRLQWPHPCLPTQPIRHPEVYGCGSYSGTYPS